MTLTTLRLGVMGIAVACLSAWPSAQGGKRPNTTTPVRLIVAVDGTPMIQNDMRIFSDGMGPYEDGASGVTASFDQYGNLIIALSLRGFCYDYGSTSPQQPPYCPGNTYMATSGLGQGETTKFQDLGAGDSQCIRGEPTYTLSDAKRTLFRHLFQRSVNGIPADQTNSAYLLATRTDNGTIPPRTWTVESASPVNHVCDNSNPGLARVVSYPQLGKSQLTDWGLYYMPMKLTLTEK